MSRLRAPTFDAQLDFIEKHAIAHRNEPRVLHMFLSIAESIKMAREHVDCIVEHKLKGNHE